MAKKKAKRKSTGAVSFEDATQRLGELVEKLESGELSLDDALSAYEEGVGLLKQCHQQLDRANRKIELLSGVDADGNPVTASFDDEEHDSLEEKQGSRSLRRTKSPEKGNLF